MLADRQTLSAGGISPFLGRSLFLVRLRLFTGGFLHHWSKAMFWCCSGYIVATLLWAFTAGITPDISLGLAVVSILSAVAYAGILTGIHRYTELDAARRADLVLGLSERLSAAMELGGTDAPYAPVLVDEAREAAPLVKAGRVAPIPWPKGAPAALIALMVAMAVTFIPYGASLGVNQEAKGDTRMAAEGYRLLEEARRVSAGAQAVGDQSLQRIGDELGGTARKMTEKFTSERKVERSLQKISQALASIRQSEGARMGTLSEASSAMEEAYGAMASGASGAEAARNMERIREAMREGAQGVKDPGLAGRLQDYAERPGEGPSESDILDAMQGLQEEAAASQARENAAGQAADTLDQSMASLGLQKPENRQAKDPGAGTQGQKGDQGRDSGDKDNTGKEPGSGDPGGQGASDSPSGNGQDQPKGATGSQGPGSQSQGSQSMGSDQPEGTGNDGDPPPSPGNSPKGGSGGTGTEGGHIKTLGSPSEMAQGTGDTQRITGTKNRGSATSTTVLGTGTAPGTSTKSRAGGASSFGGSGSAMESPAGQERIPAQYRRIISGYFGSGK